MVLIRRWSRSEVPYNIHMCLGNPTMTQVTLPTIPSPPKKKKQTKKKQTKNKPKTKQKNKNTHNKCMSTRSCTLCYSHCCCCSLIPATVYQCRNQTEGRSRVKFHNIHLLLIDHGNCESSIQNTRQHLYEQFQSGYSATENTVAKRSGKLHFVLIR